ncbi:MAG: hypothetical protein VX223_11895 [Myxococcota bacterium]|nr:hypothetical protein [Myxococcota bacterium]
MRTRSICLRIFCVLILSVACSSSERRTAGGVATTTDVASSTSADSSDGSDTVDDRGDSGNQDDGDTSSGIDSQDAGPSADTTGDGDDSTDRGPESDGNDGAEGVEMSDALDGFDEMDGMDSTESFDANDSVDQFDAGDQHDSDDAAGGALEGFITEDGCWNPSDTSGIDCTALCTAQADCYPDCLSTCPNLFANFATAELANNIITCAAQDTCEAEDGTFSCILDNPAPGGVPLACAAISNFLEGCKSPDAEKFSTWCTTFGPYVKPGVLGQVYPCFEQGCATSTECLLASSCLISSTLLFEEPGDGDAVDGGEGAAQDP